MTLFFSDDVSAPRRHQCAKVVENYTWVDPSVDHAAAALHTIYDNPVQACEKALKGFPNLVDNRSFEAVGSRMVKILQEHALVYAPIIVLQ